MHLPWTGSVGGPVVMPRVASLVVDVEEVMFEALG